MKFRTTKKAIMANYGNVIKVDYCDLQNLLIIIVMRKGAKH